MNSTPDKSMPDPTVKSALIINYSIHEVESFVDMVMKTGNYQEIMAVFNNIPPTDANQLKVYVATLQELGMRLSTVLFGDEMQRTRGVFDQVHNLNIEWTHRNEFEGELVSHFICASVRASPTTHRLLTDFPPSPVGVVKLLTNQTTDPRV